MTARGTPGWLKAIEMCWPARIRLSFACPGRPELVDVSQIRRRRDVVERPPCRSHELLEPGTVSVLGLTAVGLILVAVRSVRTTNHAIAIGLLLGGGIGNLLDRLLRAPGSLRGGVVDWIKPTLSGGSLNLADLAINAAVITILVGLALDRLRQRRDRPGDPAPA